MLISRLKKFISMVFSIPKSIYFNLRVLPLKEAIYFPFLVKYNVRLLSLSRVYINSTLKPCMIQIGFGGSMGVSPKKSYIALGKNSHCNFNGHAVFSEGCSIRNDTGTLTFGGNFTANKNCFISCAYEVSFGEDTLLGFDINIRDTDGHKIFQEGKQKEERKSVKIGNHVWICSYSDILKGSTIGDNCVVAYRSCVTGKVFKEKSLIGGYPAKVISEDINWEL